MGKAMRRLVVLGLVMGAILTDHLVVTERERILLADLNRPVIKTKSTQPTPVLLSGDLSGPSFGRR